MGVMQYVNEKNNYLKRKIMSKARKFVIPFGITPNYLLYNKDISLKAKGLFALIQSKGDDWEFTIELLSAMCTEPKDSILDALKELDYYGCLESERIDNLKF